MRIMYPLAAQLDYTELKFSLRSIDKFYSDPEIIIVGDVIPDWLTNVTQISLPDIRGQKQWTIKRKILSAFGITNSFLFMNDDVYLLERWKHIYYYHGYLKNYAESGSKQVENVLIDLGMSTKLYDGHYPLFYERNRFINACSNFPKDSIIKSMFCNYHEVEDEFILDCKLLKPGTQTQIHAFIKNRSCFSTGALSIQSAIPILEELYPYKSQFEI